jgi:hypothetical protein
MFELLETNVSRLLMFRALRTLMILPMKQLETLFTRDEQLLIVFDLLTLLNGEFVQLAQRIGRPRRWNSVQLNKDEHRLDGRATTGLGHLIDVCRYSLSRMHRDGRAMRRRNADRRRAACSTLSLRLIVV